MRKKVSGTMYLISGIAAVVLAIITKSVANNTSHHKSNIYFMGKYVGRSSWGEIYDILAVFNYRHSSGNSRNSNILCAKRGYYILEDGTIERIEQEDVYDTDTHTRIMGCIGQTMSSGADWNQSFTDEEKFNVIKNAYIDYLKRSN